MAENTTDPRTHNRKRSKYISQLKSKNFKLFREMQTYLKHNPVNDQTLDIVQGFNSQIFACSNISLYAEEPAKLITYIASNTCKNKCCFVCNWNRQKAIRRKYISWFRENETLTRAQVNGKIKILTKTQFNSPKSGAHINYLEQVQYDLMHLTLTVPHYIETGFNGQKYYFRRLMQLFNFMRKEKEWLRMVYGGEFGIETTQSKNGLHIHIHALLLVKSEKQSRNQLHRFILLKWNKLTVNKYSNRQPFTQQEKEKILKGNSLLTEAEVLSLNPAGTTFINLETIYSYKGGKKVRTSNFNSPEMIYAIMEAISYHFEPHAFNKDDKSINIPLLIEILPEVKGKPLYKKFGCLHGESALNITYKDEAAAMLQEMAEAADLKVNEETGEIMADRQYFILNPAHVCHDAEKDNNIFLSRKGRKVRKMLQSQTTTEAIRSMSDIVQRSHNRAN